MSKLSPERQFFNDIAVVALFFIFGFLFLVLPSGFTDSGDPSNENFKVLFIVSFIGFVVSIVRYRKNKTKI